MENCFKIYEYGQNKDIDLLVRDVGEHEDFIFVTERNDDVFQHHKDYVLKERKTLLQLSYGKMEKLLYEHGYLDMIGCNFYCGDDGVYLLIDFYAGYSPKFYVYGNNSYKL